MLHEDFMKKIYLFDRTEIALVIFISTYNHNGKLNFSNIRPICGMLGISETEFKMALKKLMEYGAIVIENSDFYITGKMNINGEKVYYLYFYDPELENKTVYIYALIDPRDNLIRYVGQTVHPEFRLSEHQSSPHSKRLKRWINDLKDKNMKPIMNILEETTRNDNPDALEKSYIKKMINENHPILNRENE